MALRGKTVIGGDSKQQSALMQQAASSGQQAEARVHEGLMRQYEVGQQQGQQQASALTGALQNDQQLKQQREIETGRQALQSQQLDLQAASQGLERTGGGATSPLLDERQKRLQDEMSKGLPPDQQQNLKDQGAKSMGMTKQGAFEPSEGEQEQRRQRSTAAMMKAKTDALNAKTNFQNAQTAALKAMNASGEQATKDLEQATTGMVKSIDDVRNQVTNLTMGKTSAYDIASAHTDNPDMQKLFEEIKAAGGEVTPDQTARATQFLRHQEGTMGVQFASLRGYLPPNVSPDNPMAREYNQTYQMMASSFRTLQENQVLQGISGASPALAATFQPGELEAYSRSWQGMKTYDDRNHFIGRATANAMIEKKEIEAKQRMAPMPQGLQQQLQDMMMERDFYKNQAEQMATASGKPTTNTEQPARTGQPARGLPGQSPRGIHGPPAGYHGP